MIYIKIIFLQNPFKKTGGCLENLKEVFGKNMIFWLIPVRPDLEEKLRFIEADNTLEI